MIARACASAHEVARREAAARLGGLARRRGPVAGLLCARSWGPPRPRWPRGSAASCGCAAIGFSGLPGGAARLVSPPQPTSTAASGERRSGRRTLVRTRPGRTARRPSSWSRSTLFDGKTPPRAVGVDAVRARRRSRARAAAGCRPGWTRTPPGDRVVPVRREVGGDVGRPRGDRAPACANVHALPARRGLVRERRLAQQCARRRSTGCRRGCPVFAPPCRSGCR